MTIPQYVIFTISTPLYVTCQLEIWDTVEARFTLAILSAISFPEHARSQVRMPNPNLRTGMLWEQDCFVGDFSPSGKYDRMNDMQMTPGTRLRDN
jgi:hypothetical protein